MTKAELKKLIKPLVKQCLNEVLLEEGILSTVISEVVVGLSSQNRLLEQVEPDPPKIRQPNNADIQKKLNETRQRMLAAIGKDGYSGVDVFEGTTPLKSGGAPGAAPAPTSPLAGADPNDPGVDIGRLMPGMDKVWKKLM